MTSDILQSDIELATRLRDGQRPGDEIVRALVHRGVDPVKAAQLLDDLLNGRNVTAQSTLAPELGMRRRSRATSAAAESGGHPPSRSPAAKHRSKPTARPVPQKQEGAKRFQRIYMALGALALVALGLVLFLRDKSDKTTAVAQRVPGSPLVLELRPDGLRLGGNALPRDGFLPAVYRSLGVPSRTNRVNRTGAAIYAYDQLGLLIYSQPGGGTNSIVLDCDGTGGDNGTTSPFTGSLKLENQVIGPDTDAQKLTGIQGLGLKHREGSDTLWNGRYHNMDLVFAYHNPPQRLSLIEIDLK